jgi:hypothetical protein
MILSPTQILAKEINHGWLPSSPEEKISFLAAVASAASGSILPRESLLYPYERLDLSRIRFHGMDEVPCLVATASGNASLDEIEEFCQRLPVGRIAIICALTTQIEAEAKKRAPARQCMVLGADRISQLLCADNARDHLRRLFLETFSKMTLIPFNLLRPVEGHMFFGRRFDLSKLLDQPNSSFALAGPEGLGKTSLIRQYERELIRSKDPRATGRSYVNFLSCSDATETGIARYLAMKIDPRKDSSELKPDRDEIVRFFKRQRGKNRERTLELLLDDVDEVCGSQVFQALGDCARQEICRLVLAGRSGLLELMLNKSSDLKGRLELLRLEPLDDESTKTLLLYPLEDLGWVVEAPNQFCERLSGLTGRLPHLLQYCGKKVCEIAIKRNLESIGLALLEEIKWDFETLNFVTAALRGIKNENLHMIALLLLRSRPRHVTATAVQHLAATVGIELDRESADDYCKRLVLESVLSWQKGDYQVASDALSDYAERQGMFRSLPPRRVAVS